MLFAKDKQKSPKRALISMVFLMAVISATVFFGTVETKAEPTFTVTTSELKCGEPVTFTVNVTNKNPNSTYKYYLNYVRGYADGVSEYVADPSRMTGYKTDNTFNFTFYASGDYQLRFYVMEIPNEGTLSITNDTFNYTITDANYPSVEALADSIAAQCNAQNFTTDYEKALWLHDYIINHMTYDRSYLYCGAEGALARGLGICESYHRGYTMLLKRVGISYGRIENLTSLYHVWTAVKMDGTWYQVDCTWDDSSADQTPYDSHLYFGVNTEIMDGRSTPNKFAEGSAGEFSADLACNYLVKSGHVHEYSDIYRSTIQSHINNGDTAFTIAVTNGLAAIYKNTNNALFFPAAYQLSHETWKTSDNRTVTVAVTYSNLEFSVTVTYPEPEPEPEPEISTLLTLTLPSGYTDTHVYIDGAEYTGTITNGKITIDLPNLTGVTAVMYKYNANAVPTGMYVWKLTWNDYSWEATAVPELEDLITYHGFSIRFSGSDGSAGIRFKSGIASTTKQLLKTTGVDGYKLVEIGSMYMSDANRSTYPFVKGGQKISRASRVYYTSEGQLIDKVSEVASGRERFSNVLVNQPSERYGLLLAFRAYVILENDDHAQLIIYGPIVSRSIYYVAKQLMDRGDFAPGTSGYNYLQTIITTVEGN